MNTKKLILLTAILVLLGGCRQEPVTVEPSATPILEGSIGPSPIPGSIGVTILADGVVHAAQPALTLAFESGGRLLEVYVQVGDQIQEGDILARLIEAGSLDSHRAAVKFAELSVSVAQQSFDDLNDIDSYPTGPSPEEIDLAEAELAIAQAQLTRTLNDYEIVRINALYEIGVDAQQVRDAQYKLDNYTIPSYLRGMNVMEALEVMGAELESAREDFEPYRYYPSSNEIRQDLLIALNTAQRRYDAALKLANYEIELQVAQANLDKALTEYTAEEIVGVALVAPKDGTVVSVEAAPGAMVSNGRPIVTLINTAQLEFHTTNLSDRDFALIYPGQIAVVTMNAYPHEPIEGVVVRIGWQAGAPVGDAATFPVILVLSETDLDIRPGMAGRVEIRVED
jgi:multidrug resistance efflux pump